MIMCPKCYKMNPSGSTSCQKCGTPFPPELEASQQPWLEAHQKKVKKQFRIFQIVAVVVMVIGALYGIFVGLPGNLLNQQGPENQHFNKGYELYKAGRYDEAVVELTNTIKINPNHPDAYLYRGVSYVHLEQYDLAIADLSVSIGRDSKNAYAYSFRGVAYANMGQRDMAVADFNKTIQVSTDTNLIQNARENLAKLGQTSPPNNSTPIDDGGAVGYSYWKGPTPGSYYVLNINGQRAMKVTGKPYMVLAYDKISGDIIDLEFGLSEVTIERVPNPSDMGAITPPTVDANWVDFYEKLDLKSPVDTAVTYSSHSEITYGPGTFSFRSNQSAGFGPWSEEWSFSYDANKMVGGVKNIADIGNNLIFGRDSETEAFKLTKK